MIWQLEKYSKKRMFMYLKTGLLVLLFYLSGTYLFAQSSALLLEENFEYVSGTDLAGQGDWVQGKAETNRVTVSEQGLSYTGYPGSNVGLAAHFSPLSDRVQKNFTGTLTGSYYYSFLINVSSARSGEFFAGFFSQNAFRGRIYLKADGDGFQFGLVKTTTGTVTYTSGTPYQFGTTYLVVVQYDFVSGSTNDQVSLFIDPDLEASTPGPPVVGPLSDAGNDVSANVFAMQARNNSGVFTIDAVRIAASWDAITGKDMESHYLELPRFISSDMVLQRDIPLKLHGWAAQGDTVLVELVRSDSVYTDLVEVNADNKWEVELPAQAVSTEPCQLKFSIKGYSETLQAFDNILIGDVWFAGGQSNMEKKVNHLLEADTYISEADNYSQIRSFRAAYNLQNEPSDRVSGSSSPWFVCNSSKVADNVSAVAYVFAREIHEKTGIPIGIMQAYRGGTEIETWISPWKLAEPEYCIIQGRNDFLTAGSYNNSHSVNFNGQINPLKGFPVKGFIWYQGESNTKRPLEYRYMMKMLIDDWRTLWNQGDLPFYYVQMFNTAAEAVYEEATWADLRDEQLMLLYDKSVKNIGMAVIIDTNEEALNSDPNVRMHPRNKKPVGLRLAKIALRDTYDFDILAEGPIFNRFKISNDSVYLYFRHVGDGLKIKTDETVLKGFVVSASDKQFKEATAEIINDSTVVVYNNTVSHPAAVRYAWARNPICNLYNSEDIPASPFRTDMWQLSTYSVPQSSCITKSDANKLMSIFIDGNALQEFDPDTYYYEIADVENNVDIKAIAQSPFADVAVAALNDENIVQINVTAENASVRSYELKLNLNTALQGREVTSTWSAFKQNDALVFKNNSESSLELRVNNVSGQCIFHGYVEPNVQKILRLPKDLYLLHVADLSGELEVSKLLIL